MKEKIKIKNEIISFAILPIILVYMQNAFFNIYNYNIGIVFMDKSFLLALIIYYSLFFILYALTRKTWKSITIIAIIIYIFNLINQIKIAYTGEPIIFSDLLYLNNSGELLNIIDGTIWNNVKMYIYNMILHFELSLLVCLLAYKFNISMKSKKCIITSIVIPVLILILLFIPQSNINNMVLEYFFEISNRRDYWANTDYMVYYARYGVTSGIYGQMIESRIRKPKDYSEEILETSLKNAQGAEEKILGIPNIIVVFSESFWDISLLEEVEFNKEVTSNFNRLKDKGLFFDMISPTYGGVSANVEFEFMTGGSTKYFNNGYVPYMQLYRDDSYYNRPSIISELKRNGYRTKLTSGSSEDLFSCGNVYKYFGIDETEFLDKVDFSELKGKYISDESMTNRIINDFENKKDGEKLFHMTLTMQAHMPYTKDKYDKYDVWVTKSNLPKEMNDTLTSYAQGIYDADKQLGRIYEYIQTLEEPTIIVFYGDHLPYLKTENNKNILNSLEYFNTDNELLNYYRQYNTQSLILANFDIKKENDTPKYLGPDLLSAYILSYMNIEISDYYKWLYSTKDILGASNRYVSVDQKGRLYNTQALTEEREILHKLRECMQYKYFIKK